MNAFEIQQSEFIAAKQAEFVALLKGGKRVWSVQEFRQYFLVARSQEESKAENKDPLPWFINEPLKVGPIPAPKASGVARGVAAGLGLILDVTNGYSFVGELLEGSGPVVFKEIQVPVEKIVEVERLIEVEKIVEVEKIIEKVVHVEVPVQGSAPKRDELEAAVFFPEAPPLPLPNGSFVRPAWYKRMAAALDAGKHVSLAGPPGGGKSTAPEQYFINKGQKFVTINGDAGFRRRDMEGNTEIQNGKTFFQVAEFAAAAVNGWGCILNEVNAADPDALMYINGLLEVPFVANIHGKQYPVHKNFRLVVTYNPGLIGTKALPQAFKDRFFPIKLGFPPSEFLKKILVAKGMSENASYATRLLKYAKDAWALHEKGNLRYQISPRRLFDVVFLMETGVSIEDALSSAVVDAVDSTADAQMLRNLIFTPMKELGPVSQYTLTEASRQ